MAEDRRLAAIMFADMVDFSALTQADERLALRTVEEYRRLLGPLFERYRGRVVKTLGDGFLVEFISALEATECGIEIQRRVHERNQLPGARIAEMRVGIHLGDVIRQNGDIVGDAVNIASRIEPLAESSGVCVSGPVHEQVANKIPFPFVRLDHAFLKNIQTPIAVYSIDLPWTGLAAARVTPMTDRTVELGILGGALRDAASGAGGLVAIGGEAGIGKTRISEESVHRAEGQRFQVVRGRRFEEELNAPYSHWVQAARDFFRDAPAALVYKVCDQCPREAVALVPELSDRLGPSPPAPALEPGPARQRFFEGVTRLFRNMARDAPLLIFLDDFQWADADSVALLDYVGTHLSGQKILVLLTYRDSEVDEKCPLGQALFGLRRQKVLREISLKRFDAENAQEFLGSVLGGESPPKDLVRPIIERTGGNPLFVEELCRSLVEDRSLVRTTRGWQAKAETKLEIPATVKEVIRRRVDRIGPEAEATLAVASVFGNEFEFDRLKEVSGVDSERLLLLLEAMLRARLLHETETTPGRSTFRFGDEQTRDVLYEGLSLVRRRDYHLRAGEALERALGDRASERAEELAYHFLLGNDPARAREYLIRAGDRARAIYAQEEASASYEKALELLERAIADGGDARGLRERAIAVAERLADVQRHLGRHDDVLATSRRGIGFATGLDPAARAHAWAFEGFVHEGRHEYDAALESSDRAEQALGPTPPSSGSERWWAEWVAIQQLRMGVHYWRNEPDRFAAILERLRPILEHSGRPADQLELYAQMRSLIWRKNRGIMDDRAVEYARRELQLAKGLGDPEQIAWSTFSMGFVHFWHGDLGEARGYLTTALREGDRMAEATLRSRAMTYLMACERRSGNVVDAGRLVPSVLSAAETARLPEYAAMAHATASWVAWRSHDLDRTEESGRRALEIWRTIPNRYPCDWMALWPLIAAALDRHQIERAIEYARELLPLTQNPLPVELERIVNAAIASREVGEIQAAGATLARGVEAAKDAGYL